MKYVLNLKIVVPLILVLFSINSYAAKNIDIEAESGKLTSPMMLNQDGIESVVKYKGSAIFEIDIVAEGKYDLEVKAKNSVLTQYKLKLVLNASGKELKLKNSALNQYEWQTEKNSRVNQILLKKGKLKLEIKIIDPNVAIDSFRLIPIDVKEEPVVTDNSNGSDNNVDPVSNTDGSEDVPNLYHPPAKVIVTDKQPERERLLNNIVGFASGTTGGMGGDLCEVSNLNDDGANSLRSCVSGDQKKWVVFTVSGTIALRSAITVGNNTTVDGRGQNIVITNYGLYMTSKNNIVLHNFVVKNMKEDDAIKIYKSKNIWVDHLSLESAPDGLLDITEQSNAVTVSWTKLTNHNKTMLIGANNTRVADKSIHVTLHHNYHYNTIRRNPLIRYARVHMFNNVISNWGQGTSSGDAVSATTESLVYLENNVFDPSASNKLALRLDVSQYIPKQGYVKQMGNLTLGGSSVFDNEPNRVFTPAKLYSYNAEVADINLFDLVVKNAGRQDVPYQQSTAPVRSIASVDNVDAAIENKNCDRGCEINASQFVLNGLVKSDDNALYATKSNESFAESNPSASSEVSLSKAAKVMFEITYNAPSTSEDSIFIRVNSTVYKISFKSGAGKQKYLLKNVGLNSGVNKVELFGREKNTKIYSIGIN
jgi:pectate lyase